MRQQIVRNLAVTMDEARHQGGAQNLGVLIVGIDARADVVAHQGQITRHGGGIHVFPISGRHTWTSFLRSDQVSVETAACGTIRAFPKNLFKVFLEIALECNRDE
jgi:hypothetical protein